MKTISYTISLIPGLAMASLPLNFSWPGTEVGVMLAGECRPAKVLSGPPALTQPAAEKREKLV